MTMVAIAKVLIVAALARQETAEADRWTLLKKRMSLTL